MEFLDDCEFRNIQSPNVIFDQNINFKKPSKSKREFWLKYLLQKKKVHMWFL